MGPAVLPRTSALSHTLGRRKKKDLFIPRFYPGIIALPPHSKLEYKLSKIVLKIFTRCRSTKSPLQSTRSTVRM